MKDGNTVTPLRTTTRYLVDEGMLSRACAYLEEHGFKEPNKALSDHKLEFCSGYPNPHNYPSFTRRIILRNTKGNKLIQRFENYLTEFEKEAIGDITRISYKDGSEDIVIFIEKYPELDPILSHNPFDRTDVNSDDIRGPHIRDYSIHKVMIKNKASYTEIVDIDWSTEQENDFAKAATRKDKD
jgi:hypothetical protein